MLPQHLMDFVQRNNRGRNEYNRIITQHQQLQQAAAMRATMAMNNNGTGVGGGLMNGHSNNINGKRREHPYNNMDDFDDELEDVGGHGATVLTWNTKDCIDWIVARHNFGNKYEKMFERLQVTGPILLHLSSNTLETVFRMTVKAHISKLVRSLDELR